MIYCVKLCQEVEHDHTFYSNFARYNEAFKFMLFFRNLTIFGQARLENSDFC